ncbi:MAG: glycosyltransferase family 4 protein [Fibrobacterales bacterium]
MKILFITQDYAPKIGGIETYCTELTKNIHELGISIDVICPSHKDQKELELPFNVTRIPIHSSYLFLPLLFLIPFVLRKKEYTHIIYGQWQNGLWHLFYPFLAKKYFKATLVHGRELLTSILNPFTTVLYNKVFRTMDHALPNSQAVQELLNEKLHNTGPNTIAHPGANTETFFPVESIDLRKKYGLEHKIIIGHITRLVKRKNSALLVSILPILLEKQPNLHLIIGGTGPELDTIKAKVAELQLEEHVTFLGFIPDDAINKHFNLADLFVLPSTISENDIEGFGIVYIEANCAGVPVIGFKCGGVVDAIAHNETGILCDPNQPDSLTTAILQLTSNPELRIEMGQKGRARALSHFTWRANAEKIIGILLKNP